MTQIRVYYQPLDRGKSGVYLAGHRNCHFHNDCQFQVELKRSMHVDIMRKSDCLSACCLKWLREQTEKLICYYYYTILYFSLLKTPTEKKKKPIVSLDHFLMSILAGWLNNKNAYGHGHMGGGNPAFLFFDTTSTNQLDFREKYGDKGRAGHWLATLYIPVAVDLQTTLAN